MSKLALCLFCLISGFALAEKPTFETDIPAPGSSGAQDTEKIEYNFLPGTKDLGRLVERALSELQFQQGVGHATALAILATCDGQSENIGSPDKKIAALKDMDAALKVYAKDAYKPRQVLTNNGRGGYYYVNSSIVNEPLMSQIAANLVCKQGTRTAVQMAKLLNAAYKLAITKANEKQLRWAQDLNTALMVSVILN